jgi:hypothetical protein
LPINTTLPITIPQGDPQAIVGALGVAPDNGALSEQFDRQASDLTGRDNWVEWTPFEQSYADFVVGTTVTWGAGAADDYCGFVFRQTEPQSDNNFYSVGIDRNNLLWFQPRLNDEWLDYAYGSGDSVQTGAVDSNDLVLVAVGSQFTLYVNGTLAGQFENDALAQGDVAVLSGTGENSDAAGCTFTSGWLWRLRYPPGTASTPGVEMPIRYGQSLTGALSDTVFEQQYRFSGQAGDQIEIRMSATSGDLDSFITLTDNQGITLVENDDDPNGPGRDALLANVTLPANGEYVIIATRYDWRQGHTIGGYTLTLNRVSSSQPQPDEGLPLQLGDQVTGTVSDLLPSITYTLTLDAAGVVNLYVNRLSGDLDALLVVQDANGNEIAVNDDAVGEATRDAALMGLNLPAGTYKIIVSRFQNEPGLTRGDYRLIVEAGG